MNANQVNATLSPLDQDAILAAIADIKQKLPFLVDLTSSQRQTMVKLGNKSHHFVRKALDVASQNPGILPALIGLEEMRNRVHLFESLTTIRIAIDQLQKQIDDTAMQAGSEAYATARAVYTFAKAGFAGASLQTAAWDLGKRFGRKPRAVADAAPADPAPVTPAISGTGNP